MNPKLILISGPPGTGKTSLGERLSKEFQLPFIQRDRIKELLFDSLGYSDREWSRKVGMASYDIFYDMAEAELRVNRSFILETNFNPSFARPKLMELMNTYSFNSVEIRCMTKGDVLYERFKSRSESEERHPGHVDSTNLDEMKDVLMKGEIESLNLGGCVIEWDTTDFKSLDYMGLFAKIESQLKL